LTLLYTDHKAQAQACGEEAQEVAEGWPISFSGAPGRDARIGFWAQSIDAVKGKGTARALLTFSDRNFDAEDDIAQGDQAFLDRKKFFLEKLKLSSK
jgi:hypothetical protein